MTDPSVTKMKIRQIRDERLSKESLTTENILGLIRQGRCAEARQALIFHTSPSVFTEKSAEVVNRLNQEFAEAEQKTKRRFLTFLAKLTLDLMSFLPDWNLRNKGLHGEAALSDADIELQVARNKKVIGSWVGWEKALAKLLLKQWLSETVVRFKVEGISDEGESRRLAIEFVGDSIFEYIVHVAESFKHSNLRRICELGAAGKTQTQIGNDHTTNLEYAMWLGASFVTTNPVLVDVAWELNPGKWTPMVDGVIRSQHSPQELDELMREAGQEEVEKAAEQITTDLTMEVVFENASLLRGVFLISEGRKGLVCLQVNPLKHADSEPMIREASYVYSILTRRFGGVPNVVFKLPATRAGLEAARELTGRGIGVTITVSFGLFQSLPFAEVINEGNAVVSYLVVMNGRLSSPVIDELKELGEDVAEAGRWAGLTVAKRLHQKLYAPLFEGGKAYDSKKIKIIVASLRNYEGSFPDITELVGVSVITVFPNIRRAFDADEREIDPSRVTKPVSDEILNNLFKSELFKQAYFVPDDPADKKPRTPFYLEDDEKVVGFTPVKNTLGQFCEYRIKTVERIKERMSVIAGEASFTSPTDIPRRFQ